MVVSVYFYFRSQTSFLLLLIDNERHFGLWRYSYLTEQYLKMIKNAVYRLNQQPRIKNFHSHKKVILPIITSPEC